MSDYSDEDFVYEKKKSRKRVIESESDEEFDEEERQYAKRRKCIGNFILDEAAVDDDEEEEECYDDNENIDDLIDNPDEVAEAEDALQYVQYNNRTRQNSLQIENEDEIEEHFRNKYESNENDKFGVGSAMASTITQQSCLPGVKDANLFQVKCFESEEKSTVLKLMHKFSVLRMTNTPINILSVFSKDNVKGHIYIEAYKEAHVKSAIDNIKSLSYGKATIKIIPIAEMTEVLKVTRTHKKLERGQWVRINKGLYRGDLAKVISVEESRNLVTVKLIPRIDYKPIEKNKMNFVKQKFFVKPLPSLLNRKKIIDLDLDLSKRGKFYSFRKMDFDEQGFLYKDFKMNFIDTHGVMPELQEIEKFNENVYNVNMAKVKSDFESSDQTFYVDEQVIVVEGSLKKLCGKIVSIDNKDIIVHNSDLNQNMCFRPNELKRVFFVGNRVRVLSGKYEGEVGMVVYSDNKKVVVLSDNNINQFEVKPMDLTLSTVDCNPTFSNNKFTTGDLIQIDPKTVGIILQFQKSMMKVLTNMNKIVMLEVGGSFIKKNSSHSVTIDANKKEIRHKDMVDVQSGASKGQSGNIQHVWKGFIFIFNNQLSENQGLVATKGQHVVKRGAVEITKLQPKNTNTVPQSPRIHGKTEILNQKPVFKKPNAKRNEKKIIGESVRITKGPLKGKIGIVKDVKTDSATIELYSEFRSVKVSKDHFQVCDKDGRVMNSTFGIQSPSANTLNSGNKTPYCGSQTPMYGINTPFNNEYGSGYSTPQIGKSPRYGAERADAFNPFMSTPAHTNEEQRCLESEDEEEEGGKWYSTSNDFAYENSQSTSNSKFSFTQRSPEYNNENENYYESNCQSLTNLSTFHILKNVEVLVSISDKIKRGTIVQKQGDGYVNIKLVEEKQIVNVKINSIFRKDPESCNNVVYFDPSNSTSPFYGICLSVENEEVVMKLTDGKLKMVPLKYVVPCVNDRMS